WEWEGNIARLGLFVYNGQIGMFEPPYEREAEPKRPLHIEQIPPQFAEEFKGVCFPFRFADTARFQPAEYFPCRGWQPGFLSVDGRTVCPYPGDETAYGNFVRTHLTDSEYRDELDGLSFTGLNFDPSAVPRPRVFVHPKSKQMWEVLLDGKEVCVRSGSH